MDEKNIETVKSEVKDFNQIVIQKHEEGKFVIIVQEKTKVKALFGPEQTQLKNNVLFTAESDRALLKVLKTKILPGMISEREYDYLIEQKEKKEERKLDIDGVCDSLEEVVDKLTDGPLKDLLGKIPKELEAYENKERDEDLENGK